jgi:hypothetical protein
MSRRKIVSSPDGESFELFDVNLEKKLDVFCKSLGVRLTTELGIKASATWTKKLLRGNHNVYYHVDVSYGKEHKTPLRLVGSMTNFDYWVSLWGAKWATTVRHEFLNNALVLQIVADILGGKW